MSQDDLLTASDHSPGTLPSPEIEPAGGPQPARRTLRLRVDLNSAPLSEAEEVSAACRSFLASLHHPFEIDVADVPSPPEISVVVPMLNEAANLTALYTRLTQVLVPLQVPYELIMVDDGSTDGTYQALCHLRAQDPRLKCLRLARNFGHQAALTAALAHAAGQAVVVMDADLQDPPEVIPDLLERWRQGFEVVYAVRRHRQETAPKRLAYALFYRLLHRVASVEIPLDAGDFCLMDRRVVDQLNCLPERNRFVRGLRTWVGFRQTGVAYERAARHAGRSQYDFWRLVRLAVDGLVSFSYLPLRVASSLGFAVSFLSLLVGLYYLVLRLAGHREPAGFAGIIIAVLFLGGVQLITIGIMGEYVGRIFDEVKERPIYIVAEKEGFEP
jgi:glycosyltransferase involved in cell wall biosynthesis